MKNATKQSNHTCIFCRSGVTTGRRCTTGHTPQRVFAPKKTPSSGWNRGPK